MKESFSIFIFHLGFLLITYSNSINPLNSKSEFPELNQLDFKDEEEKLYNNQIAINIKKEDNQESISIERNGTLYYITDYNDNESNIFNSSDIEERTAFITVLTEKDSSKVYNITCRLWKPTHGNLRLFCKLKEQLSYYCKNIKINNYTFNYGNYNISINFHLEWIEINQYDHFPFLYSDEQILNIDDENDSYNLKFNIVSYDNDNDISVIGGKFLNTKILNNCKVKEKELLCEIKKEDLIGILQINGGSLFLYYFFPTEDIRLYKQYPNVFNIIVNVKNLEKEDIYVGINKLLSSALRINDFIPIETNITNISNLITEGGQYKLGESNYTCYLQKDLDKPLLMLCTCSDIGIYSLKELITEEIILDNINVKYNFRIQPTNNTEEFNLNFYYGGYIYFSYPKILDFTKQNEYQINLLYKSQLNYNIKTLRLIHDLENLNCFSFKNGFTCTININYFENNPNGYYNLYQLNRINTYSIIYEVPPFEVILPKRKAINIKIKEKDNKDPIKIGEKGILYFITNYNDNERNIFDVSDIEEKTKFETLISDSIRSKIISCGLWKPNNDNLRIICKLNNYDLDQYNFRLEAVSLNYNEYIINIIFENNLRIDKKNYEIPFLYSNIQFIDIKDDVESYTLKFKIGTYNNELLYLYGEVNNSLILDKCKTNEKELNCEISKKKLEEILVKNNEQFRVEAIHDNEGLVKFDCVSNIIINYKINIKEDIYIGINGSLTDQIKRGIPFGFRTNITDIPNIYSDIQGNCFFKKFDDNPLLYLCRFDETPKEPFKFGNFTNEMVLDNLHYKYNFRIQPFKEIYKVTIYSDSTNVKLIFPEVLNFTSEDTFTITLIESSSSYIGNIWINPNSPYHLQCNKIKEIEKCNISVSHFLDQKSGYFYLYHYTEKFYGLSPIKVILPNLHIEIPIEYEDNNNNIYFGEKGLLYFKTNYSDNKANIFDTSDIEEKTTFVTTLDYYTDIYCRLWKPLNEKIWIFCKLNKSLSIGTHKITIKNTDFHYKEYTISVLFHFSSLQVNSLNVSVPFLYSDKQIIDIKEEKDSYNLKFHIGLYNGQPLCLSLDELKNITLQNCNENEKDLICSIKKEKLYEIYTNNNQKLKLSPCDYSLKNIKFSSIYDIIINFNNIQKEDIFIGITELLDNKTNINTFIAYETNITNISDIISDSFKLNFNNSNKFPCRIKKSVETSLLITCLMSKKGTFYLEEIKEEIILDKINVKYNFRIQPVNIEKKCEIKENGLYIKFAYPMVLNYYLHDTINIDYYWDSYRYKPDIILNPNSDKLTCYSLESTIQRCIVPKNHFSGKTNRYYPILYFDSFNNMKTAYQISPIQVILPKEKDIILIIKKENNNKNIIKIGQKGILYLITNFDDKTNIFNDTYVHFKTTIKDDNKNEYNTNCKLWTSKTEKLRIICKLDKKLIYNYQNISLNKVEFTYNDYNIVISQQDPFEVEQLNYDLSFLYSAQQDIKIKEGIAPYNLIFYIEEYNDEILYMYGERNNSIILDKCKRNEDKLNCEISIEKLEEILIKDNEQFRVGAINDTLGIINFDFILNITINYEIDKKEDIYVEITNLLSKYTQEGSPVAFETNVTNIPNINSDIYKSCYFKKSQNSSLLYLCNFDVDTYSYILNEELIMNNSHYKYNFRIQPFKEKYDFIVYYYGTNISLIYPEILDFTSEESLTIRYIMSEPSLAINLKLVLDSKYLECNDINGLKKCIVPLSHFIENKSGYYYLYQTNRDEPCIHYELSPIKVILPENIIEIYVNDEDNKDKIIIGKNNFLSFVTNYTDEKNIFDISDIEEKTHFNSSIIRFSYYNQDYFNVTCRLWKPQNDTIRLLCKLNEDIGDYGIKLNSVIFSYKKYNIAIISKMSFITQSMKTSRNIPLLYSDKQEINLEEDKQYYDLKFKIEEYNNEVLFLQRKDKGIDTDLTELILDDCNAEGKDLICKIEKERIIENLNYNGEIFELYYCYLTGISKFSSVLDITINYNISKKEDVFVGVTKLLQNNLDHVNYIPYETNITSILNVNTDIFRFNTYSGTFFCKMKKTINKPLLFLCINQFYKSTSSLGITYIEQKFENIHAKYNFRIQPVNRPEKFIMEDEGSKISIRYPTKLDFYKSDLISIYLIMSKPENTRGIMLNPNSEEFSCLNISNIITKCLVPKSYFNESGHYYTYYLNEKNGLNIFYDIPPILVSLPKKGEIIIKIKKNNTNIIKIGNNGILTLITDYYDNDEIFNSSDIEENTKFKAEFYGNKIIEANCRLWKPKNEKIRMICKFNENLENCNIKLNRVSLEYKGRKYSIYSEDIFMIEQLNSSISFLYSDKQEINIENNKDSYEIIFKKDAYYNEPLILYNNKMKMINLECSNKESQIICKIKKDKFLELLSFNGENYYLGELAESQGLHKFDSVLNITINYNNITKKDIYLNITKLLTQFTKKNNFIVYETNITDINKISTDYFILTPERNDNLECLLKKNDEKLLLLCKALLPGKNILGEIKKINLDQINRLYNFIIVDSKNEEEYTISEKEGTIIFSVYPEVLDFNSKDSYIIRYVTDYPERLEGIKLNPSASDKLNCENKNGFKECNVPQNHFNKDGYYYTYYNNSLGNESIAYETSTVKIILKQNIPIDSDKPNNHENKNLVGIIVGSVVGGLALIGIIVFFVVRYYRKKNISIEDLPGKNDNALLDSTED